MKIINIVTILIVLTISFAFSTAHARSFKSQSLGGTTGLVCTPTGYVGWDRGPIGVDVGYHYVDDRGSLDDDTHLIKATGTFFKMLELGITHDTQRNNDNSDWIAHGKLQFFGTKSSGKSALAIGGNYQHLQMEAGDDDDDDDGKKTYQAYQLYLAVTYPGTFFGMPSESTLVVGKTLGDEAVGVERDDVDVSIGFDLDLLPKYLKHHVHWINDFANYSYSMNAYGAVSRYRGVFNTGIRIAPFIKGRFKLNIDVLFLDALDSNRSWSAGGTLGFAF